MFIMFSPLCQILEVENYRRNSRVQKYKHVIVQCGQYSYVVLIHFRSQNMGNNEIDFDKQEFDRRKSSHINRSPMLDCFDYWFICIFSFILVLLYFLSYAKCFVTHHLKNKVFKYLCFSRVEQASIMVIFGKVNYSSGWIFVMLLSQTIQSSMFIYPILWREIYHTGNQIPEVWNLPLSILMRILM